jgi:hypothetical protein
MFFTSTFFGQDNPMFDSLDYFQRNKIRTIHCETNSWWYALPFKKWQLSFDKKTNVVKVHSFVFDDKTSSFAKTIKPSARNFTLHDTVIQTNRSEYNDTVKYFFDNKKRLSKKLFISTAQMLSDSNLTNSITDSERVLHITTITYFYADTISSKLKRTITESPYYIEESNYYYDKHLLSVRTSLDSNKISKEIKFEVTAYDYYPDKKLKKETRRVLSEHCPGIVEGTICEGIINYKYDTE